MCHINEKQKKCKLFLKESIDLVSTKNTYDIVCIKFIIENFNKK